MQRILTEARTSLLARSKELLMGTPSPMRRPKASQDYERLLKRETTAEKYWETLHREARDDVQRVLGRRRLKANG